MERFELVETEEERIERYERKKKELGWPDWKMQACDDMMNTSYAWGLENSFKKLTKDEEDKVDELFNKRKKLIEEYKELVEQLKPLLDSECELWEDIHDINKEICEIEGHRLSKKMKEEMEPDGYGTWMTLGYSRTCLICGSKFTTAKENDVVVKGEIDNLERVKIKVKK